MIFSLAGDFLVFGGAFLGLGFFFAACCHGLTALDRVGLGLGAAIVALYLVALAVYLLHLPPAVLWAPLVAGAAGLVLRRRAVRALWSDAAVPRAGSQWLILGLWCLGWQALVFSYSGGGWSGDWQEHYDRAYFFLRHWPAGHLLIDLYPLPARPPLANLVIGGLLGLTGGQFFHFQVLSTLLATLVFFPLAARVHRLRPGAAPQAMLLVLLMLSPMFVQNATFPWTKLPAAYFIVLAADWLTRPAAGLPPAAFVLVPLSLAAALLIHYSAAIWILALGGTALLLRRELLALPVHRRHLLLGLGAGALLFLTWLGWSLAIYGARVTFTANTSSGLAPAMTAMARVASLAGNIYHTLVPAWWWEGLPPLLQQDSGLARWRDGWFCLYQLNLPFAFGLGGIAVLGRLVLGPPLPGGRAGPFWPVGTALAVVINAAVNPVPDSLGLAHIALQPLVLLGLAWLAAATPVLPVGWQRVWALGLAVDFLCGIVLHFGVQSWWPLRWLEPGRSDLDLLHHLSQPAAANYFGKLRLGVVHLADGLAPPVALLLLGTGAALAWRTLRPGLASAGDTREK